MIDRGSIAVIYRDMWISLANRIPTSARGDKSLKHRSKCFRNFLKRKKGVEMGRVNIEIAQWDWKIMSPVLFVWDLTTGCRIICNNNSPLGEPLPPDYETFHPLPWTANFHFRVDRPWNNFKWGYFPFLPPFCSLRADKCLSDQKDWILAEGFTPAEGGGPSIAHLSPKENTGRLFCRVHYSSALIGVGTMIEAGRGAIAGTSSGDGVVISHGIWVHYAGGELKPAVGIDFEIVAVWAETGQRDYC